jgi:uncharacterized protein (TIGR03437 family)
MHRIVRYFALVLITTGFVSGQTTLNLSEDLVRLGVAPVNMVPNQPNLDAGPLLFQATSYAQQNGIQKIIADPGTYYFLTLMQQSGGHVQLGPLNNLTIDFQGSGLIFTHPLFYGIILSHSTNVTLQNFTVDYEPLPYTQLRVLSMDTAHETFQYSVEPGWQSPTAFNSLPLPPGQQLLVELHLYRNGQPVPGTTRMSAQMPFAADHLQLAAYAPNAYFPTPASAAQFRPGDIAVLAMRDAMTGIVTTSCTGCTLRNIQVYSAANSAVDMMFTSSGTVERVYAIPKPGTDRLVSTIGGINVMATGPNNQILLSRAIRTLDDGFAFYNWVTGQVQSQSSSRMLTVEGDYSTSLADGVTTPTGTSVVFQQRSDGKILGNAIIVSQTPASNTQPPQVTFTFDRDLPSNLIGAVMYPADANQRGNNSTIQRNAVEDSGVCCHGADIWGWEDTAFLGNYLQRTAWSVEAIQTLVTTNWVTPPVVGLTFSNNVVDMTNLFSDNLAPTIDALGGIEVVTLCQPTSTTFGLMPTSPNQNITISNNFIANPGKSAVWVGNTVGGSVSGNLLLHPNDHPVHSVFGTVNIPALDAEALLPVAIDATSSGIAVANNSVDQSSGRVWVTDVQFNELAAYAPGKVYRLNAYNLGALTTPSITLTDADGKAWAVTVQTTAVHSLDVLLPATAGLGGAYLTVTAGTSKYFGTLFLDSQDNIPALNGCTWETSAPSLSPSANATTVPILVVTQAGCTSQVLATDSFVNAGSSTSGTSVIQVGFTANTGAARTTTIEIAGQPITLTQAAGNVPTITNVQNAATYQTTLAPNTYAIVFGSDLSTTSPGRSWTAADFKTNGDGTVSMPNSLDGTSVSINGTPAYISYISPGQINIVIPDIPSGNANVVVTMNGQTSVSFPISLQPLAPSFFTWQPNTPDYGKYLIAQHTDYSDVGKTGLFPGATPAFTTPAKPGETITLYATGFGPTSPPIAAGIQTDKVYALSPSPTATLGNLPAQVVFAGLIPPLSQVYQVNVTIPSNAPDGDQALVLNVNSTLSYSGLITVQH